MRVFYCSSAPRTSSYPPTPPRARMTPLCRSSVQCSACYRPTSKATTSSCSNARARSCGLSPALFLAAASAPAASSKRTRPVCPSRAAMCSGVLRASSVSDTGHRAASRAWVTAWARTHAGKSLVQRSAVLGRAPAATWGRAYLLRCRPRS